MLIDPKINEGNGIGEVVRDRSCYSDDGTRVEYTLVGKILKVVPAQLLR